MCGGLGDQGDGSGAASLAEGEDWNRTEDLSFVVESIGDGSCGSW